MSTIARNAGRRRILAAAAGVLTCLGALLVVVGLRGQTGPPQPAPDRLRALQ